MNAGNGNQVCSSCAAPISLGEVAEGLAVRVDGKLVCPLCVDTLPGSAQVKINQMRALRGLDVTTYSLPSRKHPDLGRYTFTTTSQLNQHRRTLTSTGSFKAPPLPIDHKPIPRLAPPTTAPKRPPWLPIGIAAAVVIAIGTIIGLAAGGTTRPTAERATTQVPVLKRRLDYAAGPRMAWDEASRDRDCPPELLTAIAKELESELAQQVDQARILAAEGRFAEARQRLETLHAPDDIRFAAFRAKLADQTKAVAESEAKAITAQTSTPTPPVPPLPVPTPPEVVAPEPPPAVPDPPVAQVPTPAPVEPPTPDPVAAPDPVAPAADLAWRIHAADLQERPGKNAFRVDDDRSLAMVESSGTVSGTFALPPGTYRCWLRLAPGSEKGMTASVIVNGKPSASLRFGTGDGLDWYAMDLPNLILLFEESSVQVVIDQGKGSILHALHFSQEGGADPLAGDRDGAFALLAPTRRDAQPSEPAEPVEPTSAVVIAPLPVTAITNGAKPWDEWNGSARDKGDEAHYTFPGNAGPFTEAVKERSRASVRYRLDEALTAPAGLAFLVHPQTITRTDLKAVFEAADGTKAEVDIAIPEKDWNTCLAPVPPGNTLWTAVTIEDARDTTTVPFVLGKVVPVVGRPPTVDDLALRPRAWTGGTYADLGKLVFQCGAKRKARNVTWIKVTKLKFLIAQTMTAGNWTTTVRAGLEGIFSKAWSGKAPNGTISTFQLNDTWLDKLYQEKDPKKALVHPSNHHVLVILTAGNEQLIGLDAEQAVRNFWLPFIQQTIDQGILPVPVLGPTRVDDQHRANTEKMWELLHQECLKAKIPIPIIDLRPAQALSQERMASGGAQLASDLLVDALHELNERCQRLPDLTR